MVPSPSVAEVAREWCDVPQKKIVVIPNAIAPVDFERLERPAEGDQFPIGFLGRLDPIKRIPDLVTALRDVPRAHLHIFGEGPERGEIERTAVQLGLTRRLTLHGSVERPQDALSKVRLLILPSAAEGFGLVLIEAMAAGIPVVATDVAGIRDVVKNEVTGLLVPPAQPRRLADAINRLLDDPLLRNGLVEAAAADVRERFTWNVVLPKYRAILGV